MEENSIGYKNNNYNLNKSVGRNKKIKIIYPKYISTRDLKMLQKHIKKKMFPIFIKRKNIFLMKKNCK